MQYILIADDNEDIREVLSTYVVKEGFEPSLQSSLLTVHWKMILN